MRRRTKEKKEYRDALAEQVQPHLDTEVHSICSIHMYVVYVCTDIHIPTSQISPHSKISPHSRGDKVSFSYRKAIKLSPIHVHRYICKYITLHTYIDHYHRLK